MRVGPLKRVERGLSEDASGAAEEGEQGLLKDASGAAL